MGLGGVGVGMEIFFNGVHRSGLLGSAFTA